VNRKGKHYSLHPAAPGKLEIEAARLTQRLGVKISASDIISRFAARQKLSSLVDAMWEKEIEKKEREEIADQQYACRLVERMDSKKK
jgi:hypothetical protein